MIGVCEFEKTVPLSFRKLSRCGICSRSDGTFGLSREKWTLSKTMLITCWTPFPRQHDVVVAASVVRGAASEPAPDVTTTAARPAPTESARPDGIETR